jgi:hypothetical protein
MSGISNIRFCGVDLSGTGHLSGPLWGNILIVIVAGTITIGCFVVMLKLLWRPGETRANHPKFTVLRHDR